MSGMPHEVRPRQRSAASPDTLIQFDHAAFTNALHYQPYCIIIKIPSELFTIHHSPILFERRYTTMSSSAQTAESKRFYAPSWHGDARTPVVDGKYEDPETGAIRVATDAEYYGGPPEVDIIILSIHEETRGFVYRSSRPFKVEHLLFQMVKIVNNRRIQIDSLNANALRYFA